MEEIHAKSTPASTKQPAISFQTVKVPPPSPLYVTPDDTLLIEHLGSVGSVVTIQLQIRFLRADGEIITSNTQFDNDGARNAIQNRFNLAEGHLLSVSLWCAFTAPQRGQLFARALLTRGALSVLVPAQTLVSGYIHRFQSISWPGGQQGGPLDGPGALRAITGTDPAPGVEISETVPTNTRWRLLALRATLTTDATVASRLTSVFIDNGASVFFETQAGSLQTASLSISYNLAQFGHNVNGALNVFHFSLPNNFLLSAGFRIRTSTLSLQAGDNWSAPVFLVEEWIQL